MLKPTKPWPPVKYLHRHCKACQRPVSLTCSPTPWHADQCGRIMARLIETQTRVHGG